MRTRLKHAENGAKSGKPECVQIKVKTSWVDFLLRKVRFGGLVLVTLVKATSSKVVEIVDMTELGMLPAAWTALSKDESREETSVSTKRLWLLSTMSGFVLLCLLLWIPGTLRYWPPVWNGSSRQLLSQSRETAGVEGLELFLTITGCGWPPGSGIGVLLGGVCRTTPWLTVGVRWVLLRSNVQGIFSKFWNK